MLNKYPARLPAAQKMDRAFQMVDPLVSSTSDNGQTRWDRQFTDVPTSTPISWIFSDLECQAFEGWYRGPLRDGAEWFELRLRSPMGYHLEECHFVSAYSGPVRLGYNRWRIEAQVVLRRRPVPSANDGEFPDDILTSGLFDRTLNWEWPSI